MARDHFPQFQYRGPKFVVGYDLARDPGGSAYILKAWREAPRLGSWDQVGNECMTTTKTGKVLEESHETVGWIPRAYYRETLTLLIGEDLGNDPGAWEAWFKAHPNLVWDPKAKRLVDRPARP